MGRESSRESRFPAPLSKAQTTLRGVVQVHKHLSNIICLAQHLPQEYSAQAFAP
jgi:hypothetical protein